MVIKCFHHYIDVTISGYLNKIFYQELRLSSSQIQIYNFYYLEWKGKDMGLTREEEYLLRQSIQNCSAFQGKYYLWHIFHILKNSSRSQKKISKLVSHVVALTDSVNKLNSLKKSRPDNLEAIANAFRDLNDSYTVLAEETGSQGIFYNFRQTILGLGGCILGTIGAIAGAVTGACIGFFNDISACRLPTGTFFGIIAGAHVGASLGYRLPDRLIKDPEQHALQYAIRELHRTFESLTTSLYEDTLADLKQTLLMENFDGNERDFEDFQKREIFYEILATDAGMVLSEKVQGYLGHHIWITFRLPGSTKAIRIESGEEMALDSKITQREPQKRLARGEKLLQMLALHKVLSPIYVLKLKPENFLNLDNIKNLLTYQYRYKPGVTDCNTYVDEILTTFGEDPTQTQRFADNDKAIALWIRDAIRFLSPLPKELDAYQAFMDEETPMLCSKAIF